jgi:two-component system, response regulator
MNSTAIEILLVEDDPDDIELTQKALVSGNVINNLHIVRDGQEALDFLYRKGDYEDEKTSPRPGLILLDIKLPKVDGTEVLKQIKSDPDLLRIPVVMLTTSKREEDIFKSYSNHANSYIEKPVAFEDFISTIKGIGLYWLITNTMPTRNDG